jgi:hypothetical protein
MRLNKSIILVSIDYKYYFFYYKFKGKSQIRLAAWIYEGV